MGNPLNKNSRMECPSHGIRMPAFICQHLRLGTGLGFNQPHEPFDPEWPFQNAWCDECDKSFVHQGEWNDVSESFAGVTLICEGCFEEIRGRNPTTRAEESLIFGDRLRKALENPHPDVRLQAIRDVARSGNTKYCPQLHELLKKERADVAVEIAGTLGILGDPSSVQALAPMLQSQDRLARAVATQTMHKIHLGNRSTALLHAKYFVFNEPGVRFLMIVNDIFGIEGKGTIATGVISTGTVAVGDALLVRKADGRDLVTACDGIDRFKGDSGALHAGESIGVHLRGLSMGELGQGDSLVRV